VGEEELEGSWAHGLADSPCSLPLRHPIDKLIAILPTNPPPQPPLPLNPKTPPHNPHAPQTPETHADDAGDGEPGDCDQHPVLAHPEDGLGVLAVPAAALGDVEEAPLEPLVLVRHEDAHVLLARPLNIHVLLPDHREEERPRRVHDRDVRHRPVAVVARQALDHAQEERVLGHGAHRVVADAGGHGAAHPGWVREQRVQTSIAAVVEVDVDPAVEGEHEVPDCIGALDGEAVAVEGGEEPGVFCTDEFAGEVVGPELFLCQCGSQTSDEKKHLRRKGKRTLYS
jgi:hypothetical protein